MYFSSIGRAEDSASPQYLQPTLFFSFVVGALSRALLSTQLVRKNCEFHLTLQQFVDEQNFYLLHALLN